MRYNNAELWTNQLQKKKGQAAEADVASNVEDTEILMASYEENTSQGKDWIFDSRSTVHICSQKELFNNFLVPKEKGIVKIVDGSACEVICTGTVKVTEKDGQCMLWRRSGMSQRHGII